MSIEAGGAFKCNSTELTNDELHLWIILSDPAVHPECVVVVNLTSRTGNKDDPACRLNAGDHPFVIRPTYVKYSEAHVVTAQQLEDADISHRQSLNSNILQRIRDGAGRSKSIRMGIKKHLVDQGIIPS